MKNLLLLAPILFFHFLTFSQNALHFDGNDDYVQTTYSGVSGANDRTIEAWVRPTYYPTQIVVVDWGTFATGQRYTLNLIDGKPRVEVSGSGVTSSTSVTDGQWHHVACTYEDGAATQNKIFIDGILDTSFNLTVSVNTGSSVNMRIGVRVDGANEYDGDIDEVRVWDKALSATEISSSMNNELCASTNLVAYYRFNNGTAGGTNTGITSATDFSGFGNTGTLNNFGLTGATSNWVTGKTLTAASAKTSGPHSISGCVPYTSLGGQTWQSTGTFQDTIPASNLCDSIRTIDFIALNNSSSSIKINACNSYLAPSGVSFNKTGMYTDVIPNHAGCDSSISIDLTVYKSHVETYFPSACGSYTLPSGLVVTVSGNYKDTFTTVHGMCDSIINTYLTLVKRKAVTVIDSACGSYVTKYGKTWYTSGTYKDTVLSSTNCDTIITYYITIHHITSNTITDSACGSYTSSIGKVYTSTGIYDEHFTSKNGCDSLISWDVTIRDIAIGVTQNNETLTSNEPNANYQWYECDSGYTAILGAINQSFTTTKNGNYAVVVFNQLCRDTSKCFSVTSIEEPNWVETYTENSNFRVFPNPVKGLVNILIHGKINTIQLFDSYGKMIPLSRKISIENKTIDTRELIQGVYFIKVTQGSHISYSRFIKH